jgi:hypothetical protein
MTENICSACNKAPVDSNGLEYHTFVCPECYTNPAIPDGWRRLKVDEEVEPGDRQWDQSASEKHAEWDDIEASYFAYMDLGWQVDVDEVIIRRLPDPKALVRKWSLFLGSLPEPTSEYRDLMRPYAEDLLKRIKEYL